MRSIFFTFLLFFSGALFAQNPPCNCCEQPHTDFDFWMGKWEVVNAKGEPAGHNTIRKIEDGCVLMEQYTAVGSGYSGSSFNFYNSRINMWEQLWVDNQGNHLHLRGKLADGKMVLDDSWSENADRVNRITWTALEDGRVRQLWEVKAGEAPWSVIFDGYYSRVE